MLTTLAKITPPHLPGIFPRDRLFCLLDRARERPVTWISAPPGAGKTTLAASWLKTRKIPSLWYQVDEGDGDVATLFYYLGMATGKITPGSPPLPPFARECQASALLFGRNFFENLYSRLPNPSVIVYDNYQEAPPGSRFHEVMRAGLDQIPEGINVLLISRNAPPETVTYLKSANRIAVLEWEEMRLSLEETAGVATLRGREKQSDETVRLLHEKTQGWAAGLILMLEHPPGQSPIISAPGTGSLDEIFEYFAGEIFAKMDVEVRDFLVKTAFLPKMTGKMAEKLTSFRNSEQLLNHLVRNHYFTQRHFGPEPVYQYHALFRDFLLSRGRELYAQPEVSRLKEKAADILEEASLVKDAAELFLETEKWERFGSLIISHARSLLAQGMGKTLGEWIAKVPQQFLGQSPWLLFWLGACRLAKDPAGARESLEKALEGFVADGNPTGAFLSWACAIDTFLYDPSGARQIGRWVGIVQDLIDRFPVFPAPDVEASVATGMLIALVFRQPQHPAIGKWAKRAFTLSTSTPDLNLRIKTAQFLALYYHRLGDLAGAQLVMESLRAPDCYEMATPFARIRIKLIEALHASATARNESCLAAVSEALTIAEASGLHILDFLLHGQEAHAALSEGDATKAGEYLGKMALVVNTGRRSEISHYYRLASWHSLLEGEDELACERALLALDLAVETSDIFAEAPCYLLAAYAQHRCGEHDKAGRLISETQRIGRLTRSPLIEHQALLFLALFAYDGGDDESALASLRKAMAIGRRHGIMNFEGWHPAMMVKLCLKALEAGIEVRYVQEIIRRRNLVPETPPLHIELWPWPLKIYTFGRFSLLKDGAPVRFSGKVQQKPLELLKAVISLGGRNVSEQRLRDLLWPNVPPDAAHQTFAVTLHRLRHLLGKEGAILLQEGRATLNPQLCWVDAWAFERFSGQAKSPLLSALSAARHAISLYHGHFLAGDSDRQWSLSTRERLQSKMRRLISSVGHFHEDAGEWQEAVENYLKGLETDSLAEDFYQRLMVCYRRLGLHGEIASTYNRCCIALAMQGIKPSPQTKAVYEASLQDRQP